MKRTGAKVILILLISVLVLFIVPFFSVISISDRKNPSEKIYLKNEPSGFVISYTHSVNKGRVHDYYRTERKNFILYKTEFVSYGAGMPELEETPGAVFYKTGDTYTMEYKRNAGRFFLLSVGVIAEHSVRTGNHEFFLKDFFKPKTSLVFKTKKISLIEFLVNRRRIM